MSEKSDNELEGTPAESAAPVEPVAEPLEIAEEIIIDPRDLEIASLKDRLLRLQADFDNFRKRTVRDRDEMARRAAEKILKEILPAIDHFELGIQAARNNHVKHSVIEGFEGIVKQFQSILERAGVTAIETKGQPFDPHSHECVAQIPSEEHPENIVIEETRRGYRLGNYILRAAQVIVSSGPAQVAPANTP